LQHQLHIHTIAEGRHRLSPSRKAGATFSDRRFFMRRLTALSAAACIAVAATAVVSPAQAGYYLVRWDNTGVCQVWNDTLTFKPVRWPSDYKVVSKPVPTFAAAFAAKETMRQQHRCTW
jgi:hypothetical protein